MCLQTRYPGLQCSLRAQTVWSVCNAHCKHLLPILVFAARRMGPRKSFVSYHRFECLKPAARFHLGNWLPHSNPPWKLQMLKNSLAQTDGFFVASKDRHRHSIWTESTWATSLSIAHPLTWWLRVLPEGLRAWPCSKRAHVLRSTDPILFISPNVPTTLISGC